MKPKTEWKVKIASLGSFVGALAGAVILDEWAPSVLAGLPDSMRLVAGAILAGVSSWLSGYLAKSRPESVSASTIEAVREHLRRSTR